MLDQISFIPLGAGVNSEKPRFLLSESEAAYAYNFRFLQGYIGKRHGITDTGISISGCEIVGVYKYDNSQWIIIYYDTASSDTYKCFGKLWNGSVSSPAWTENIYPDDRFMLGTSEWWDIVRHYDDTIGNCAVMSNGVDHIMKWVPGSGTTTLMSYTDINAGNYMKGKYLQSFKDALYLGNITDYGTGVSDPYTILYSEIGDATNLIDPDHYMQIPEDGTHITCLRKYKDMLIFGKGGNKKICQAWGLSPYSETKRINASSGPSNQWGVIDGERFVYSDNGRIIDLESGEWLSQPIHTLFASKNAGSWDTHATHNLLNRKLLFSSADSIFVFNEITKAWEYYRFGGQVKLVGHMMLGEPSSEWLGVGSSHDYYTAAEEDAIANYLVVLNKTRLCIMNHKFDDNDTPISCRYETRLDACGNSNIKKKFREVIIQGGASQGPISVYGFFSDYPEDRPTWTLLGTITLNAYGYGKLAIRQRAVWASLAIFESSTNALDIYKLGLKWQPCSDR